MTDDATPPSPPHSPAPVPPVPAPLPDAPGEPQIERENRLRLSLVWLVPLVAVVIGLGLLARTLLQAGPQIVIEFRTAEGLEANRTEVRYKEVVVGRVTHVGLSSDRQKVLANVELDKSAAGLAASDSKFWVVRPRVGTAGVSGLNTLLSGAYIGVDAGTAEAKARRFVGLEVPPFVLRGEPGRSFVLSADDLGSLDIGSPVYYRRTRVGRVVGYTLDPARDALAVQVFIESPNERLVTANSRFWNASGVDVALGANGLTVNTQSIASVLAGGVAFGSADDAGSAPPAAEGARFHLFGTRQAALAPPDGPSLMVRLVFDQSVRGLSVGAPVDLLGVEIGTVRRLRLERPANERKLVVEAEAELYPSRLGSIYTRFAERRGLDTRQAGATLIGRFVDHGLRAQLRNGNLLTGQLFVALEFMPKAPPASFDTAAALPELPTTPGTFADIQPQIAAIIARIGRVPFDEIGQELNATLKSARGAAGTLQDTLANANRTIDRLTPEAQATLADVRRTLGAAQSALEALDRNVAQPDAPLQRQTAQAIAEVQRAAQAIRVLADYLQRHPESVIRGKPADRPAADADGATR